MEIAPPNPVLFTELQTMREKWKRGSITTRQYHEFIEVKKRSLAGADSFFQV